MLVEERNWLRLHLTPGLGRRRLIRLMEVFGTAEAIMAAPPATWKEAGIDPALAAAVPAPDAAELARACRSMEKVGAQIVPLADERYPELLRSISDPPALLYVRGELPAADALAVVGSRLASEAGRRLTSDICAELAARDIVIVSGLARGIDSAAHLGALEGGGITAGVLGCGIDRVYPPENARLFHRLLEQGGAILSEYPPGTPPLAGHFPGRNRIISGISRGVLVVEAAEGSGSLISADFALEQGREVFAVPGPVASPISCGVNQLLKDGAHLVTGAADILAVLWPQVPRRQVRQEEENFAAALAGNDLRLYEQLAGEPVHIDYLARKSGLTPMEVSAILLHLELRGGVEALPGMRYIKRRRS